MVGEASDDAELEVGQRADGERDLLADQAVDERGVLVAANTVVDALDLEQIERLADVTGGAFFAGVGDRWRPRPRARVKTRSNLLGGLPRSPESRPTPMKSLRNGMAASRVARASASER